MANYYNAQIGVVDASGTVNVIYPITKSTNVDVTSKVYGSGSATTVLQTALDNIVTKIGTIKSFAYSDLNTTYTSSSTSVAASASAVKSAYDTLNSNNLIGLREVA
jgi:hypothetical protein